LRDAGLVSERKQGRQRYYYLEAAPLMELQEWLQPYERFWRERFSNLHKLLQEDHEEQKEQKEEVDRD
jgi:DNA-binding transcriptional ArsR family regulator